MGGTTAKLSLVDGGEPLVAYGLEAARQKRFIEGSGLPIRLSTIELIEIGAGGGSIARRDEIGLLKVGPDSAGSSQGPPATAVATASCSALPAAAVMAAPTSAAPLIASAIRKWDTLNVSSAGCVASPPSNGVDCRCCCGGSNPPTDGEYSDADAPKAASHRCSVVSSRAMRLYAAALVVDQVEAPGGA